VAAALDFLVLDEEIINKVNNHPQATWKAGRNEIFENRRFSEIKNMLGAFLIDPETDNIPKVSYQLDNFTAPTEFDGRKQWPSCIHPIRNQQQCGSCWAFSATEVVSDRFCIATQGKTNVILSPQDMVSCDTGDYGCQGGILSNLWNYYAHTGTVTDSCFPYSSGGGVAPACRSSCVDGTTTFKKYKVTQQSVKHFNAKDLATVQNDLMTNGPIQTGFKVYRDFFSYKSGVYRHLSGSFAGGHAVKVIGWGVDSKSNLPYWIVANSWGSAWGQDGFFWILRGKDECGLESNLWTANPDLSSL
jgi:cathepsin B